MVYRRFAALLLLLLPGILSGAATTPSPGLRYYYPAPEAPVVYVDADIVVYGGTPGGVTAAIQARRMGKSVALVVFGRHVGGMTGSGLTQTDGVNAAVQGGICREFFDVVGNSSFQPATARATFENMLADPVPGASWDAPIPVYYEQRLDWVEKDGARISALHMENGSVFRGKMFIDCSYEGDLMARAGVSYTVGRESQVYYAEPNAGKKNPQVVSPHVDPYIIPGDPSSGLIWGVNDEPEGELGTGDPYVQGYNFRMYLAGSGPIWEPMAYDPAMFEVLYRWIRNGADARVPSGNDINNHEFNGGVISSDVVGQNWDWPDADYATREEIFQEHVAWHMGMFWYYKTDPRFAAMATDPTLPSSVRNEVQDLINRAGNVRLPLDQYPDTNGWPHELYIREARRMVSDFVATQVHYERKLVVGDPVALPNYTADSHNVRRIVVDKDTSPKIANAGNTGGSPTTPWRLSYRSMTPPREECTNLLVAWAVSASHVAFASIRMEPTLMVLGQSAATAASLAIDDQVDVQDLAYPKLKMQLLADGQLLGSDPVTAPDEGIVVDNGDAPHFSSSGDWVLSTGSPGYYGLNYFHDGDARDGGSEARYFPPITEAGAYRVYLRWTSNSNRASNVPIEIIHAGGVSSTTVNMKVNGGNWNDLGVFNFAGDGTGGLVLSNTATNGYVIADAARFVPLETPDPEPLPGVHLIATVSSAEESSDRPAAFTIARNDGTTEELTIHVQASGPAVDQGANQALPSTYLLPAGIDSVRIEVLPVSDDTAQGDRLLHLEILPDPTYAIGEYGSAELIIRDKPYDAWRHQHFSPFALENDSRSFPEADFDLDGLKNFLEFAFGSDPVSGIRLRHDQPTLVFTDDPAEGDRLELLFRANPAAGDINFQLLRGLAPDSMDPVEQVPVFHRWDELSESPILEFSEPFADDEKLFFQIKVSPVLP